MATAHASAAHPSDPGAIPFPVEGTHLSVKYTLFLGEMPLWSSRWLPKAHAELQAARQRDSQLHDLQRQLQEAQAQLQSTQAELQATQARIAQGNQ
jgi:peptidoglycan hydrolase CwlO-like protein